MALDDLDPSDSARRTRSRSRALRTHARTDALTSLAGPFVALLVRRARFTAGAAVVPISRVILAGLFSSGRVHTSELPGRALRRARGAGSGDALVVVATHVAAGAAAASISRVILAGLFSSGRVRTSELSGRANRADLERFCGREPAVDDRRQSDHRNGREEPFERALPLSSAHPDLISWNCRFLPSHGLAVVRGASCATCAQQAHSTPTPAASCDAEVGCLIPTTLRETPASWGRGRGARCGWDRPAPAGFYPSSGVVRGFGAGHSALRQRFHFFLPATP